MSADGIVVVAEHLMLHHQQYYGRNCCSEPQFKTMLYPILHICHKPDAPDRQYASKWSINFQHVVLFFIFLTDPTCDIKYLAFDAIL